LREEFEKEYEGVNFGEPYKKEAAFAIYANGASAGLKTITKEQATDIVKSIKKAFDTTPMKTEWITETISRNTFFNPGHVNATRPIHTTDLQSQIDNGVKTLMVKLGNNG
jgi:hypothetical protein